MKPTILLTGKTGQVGSELNRLLPGLGPLIALGRGDLGLAGPAGIRRVLRDACPQVIVNAAAYTAVDAAENDQSQAYAINAEAPALMAEEAKRLGAVLVHYSTDFVFDGAKKSPYLETDATNPLNVYGKSKLAGEQAIRDSGAFHLIFRTSWIYSTRGKNFLLTILRLATEREELKIVSDQLGAPTCAWDVARATTEILSRMSPRNQSELQRSSSFSGTYHLTASGQTSWYEFARAILEKASTISSDVPWFAAATNGRPLITKRIVPIATEEFRSPARRPAYSVLSNLRLSETFHLTLPDWATQLQHCLAQRNVAAPSPQPL